MARTYAALPFDYIEEMALLSDEEFGRLCRALMEFAKTGGGDDLIQGNERFLWNRVKANEARHQASYEALIANKRIAGKRGAEKRWGKKNNTIPSEQVASEAENDGANSTASYSANESNLPPQVPSSNFGVNPDLGEVIRFYQDNLCFDMPRETTAVLSSWIESMGKDTVLLGLQCATQGACQTWNGSSTWGYVKKIFQAWIGAGVHNLEDAQRYIANRNARGGGVNSGYNNGNGRTASESSEEQKACFRGTRL